jgi:hypothetical protein
MLETKTVPLAQNYAPPAHNKESEANEEAAAVESYVRIPRANLLGTRPIRTFS